MHRKMTLILGAMDSEIAAFLDHMHLRQRHEVLTELFVHEGVLNEKPVTVARCGVGKALSALSTQAIIDSLTLYGKRPAHIIFTGLAGAINKDFHVGDTLVVSDCVQHDLDATALGIPRGTVPDTKYRFLPADAELFKLAMTYQPNTGRIFSGRILTGDQFIHDRNAPHYQYMTEELEGDGVEMEGAAVALCAALNKIPFILIRTISDEADGNAKVNFRDFLPLASQNSLKIVMHILEQMDDEM